MQEYTKTEGQVEHWLNSVKCNKNCSICDISYKLVESSVRDTNICCVCTIKLTLQQKKKKQNFEQFSLFWEINKVMVG